MLTGCCIRWHYSCYDIFWRPWRLSNPVPQDPLRTQTICTASHSEPPDPPVCQWRSTLSHPLVCAAKHMKHKWHITQKKKLTWKGSYYKITDAYLRMWLRQEVFWYWEMVQFILVGVNEPVSMNSRFRQMMGEGERKKKRDTRGALHIYMFLGSLLVNEVSEGRGDIQVLRSLFGVLFVGEIFNRRDRSEVSLMLRKQEMGRAREQKARLTWRKRFYCIGLHEDLRNKRCVAVVNFFLEFQLRPCNILGMEQPEHLRATARAWTLIMGGKKALYATMCEAPYKYLCIPKEQKKKKKNSIKCLNRRWLLLLQFKCGTSKQKKNWHLLCWS